MHYITNINLIFIQTYTTYVYLNNYHTLTKAISVLKLEEYLESIRHKSRTLLFIFHVARVMYTC